MRVMGNQEPQAVEIFLDLAGRRYARLAKNIEQDVRDAPEGTDDDPQEFFVWDEIEFATNLSEGDIEENFDDLWYRYERLSMDEQEWREDIDAALLDIMEELVS